jgi:hypothetical protein
MSAGRINTGETLGVGINPNQRATAPLLNSVMKRNKKKTSTKCTTQHAITLLLDCAALGYCARPPRLPLLARLLPSTWTCWPLWQQ